MRYAFDDFELDTELFELRRGASTVPLEPQVFDLLAYLVQHHERVVPKDELLDHIWPERYITEAALNSRLMAARKAVGDSGRDQRLIRTLHGRGYRFVGTVKEPGGAGRETTPVAGSAASGSAEAPQVPSLPQGVAAVPPPGRRAELEAITGAFSEAREGRSRIVFVTGEPGIGKTTLVSAFLQQVAEPSGALVARGLCIEHFGQGEAYLPVLDAVSRLAKGPAGEAVVRTLRQLAPSWLLQLPWLVPPEELQSVREATYGTNHERMLREMVEACEALAARFGQLVVVLEDLHWADHSTVDLVSALARRSERSPILLIGTFRPADLRLSTHPLDAIARELLLVGLASEVPVSPLDAEAIAGHLRQRFDGRALPPGMAESLERRSDGNPLFVTHLIDAWVASGALRMAQDTLDWDAATTHGIGSDSLRELLLLQMERLAPAERDVLAAGAVAGLEFSAAVPAAALELAEDEVEHLCDALARRGLVIRAAGLEEWPDGSVSAVYQFIHHLCQDALYERHSPASLVRLHRRVGETLELRSGSLASAFAARLAYHFEHGRDAQRAVRYRRMAAELAMSRGGYREAAIHFQESLRMLERQPDAQRDRHVEMQLLAALASTLVATEGFATAEGEAAYRRALELATMLDDRDHAVGAIVGLAVLLEFQGRHAEAEELLAPLPTLIEVTDAEAAIPVHQLHSCAAFHRGSFSVSVEQGDLGLRYVRDTGPDLRWAAMGEDPHNGCREWSAHALWFVGRADSAVSRIAEAIANAEQPGNQFALASAHSHAARVFQLRNEPERCRQHGEAAIALSQENGFAYGEASGTILLGWALATGGSDAAGVELIRRGIELHSATGATMDRSYYLALLAEAAIATGQMEIARQSLADAFGSLPDGGFFYTAELHRLRGELALQSNPPRMDEAEAAFQEGLAVARAQSALALELRGATSLARLWATTRPADALALLNSAISSLREGRDTVDFVVAASQVAQLSGSRLPS